MWTIDKLEKLGLELISNDKLWCHFRGYGFDIFINLDTTIVKGNLFNFHSYKSAYKGNFRAAINTPEEFLLLMNMIK